MTQRVSCFKKEKKGGINKNSRNKEGEVRAEPKQQTHAAAEVPHSAAAAVADFQCDEFCLV